MSYYSIRILRNLLSIMCGISRNIPRVLQLHSGQSLHFPCSLYFCFLFAIIHGLFGGEFQSHRHRHRGKHEIERNKQKTGSKETKSLVSDMTEFRCRNFHEERSSTSLPGTAPRIVKIDRCYSRSLARVTAFGSKEVEAESK